MKKKQKNKGSHQFMLKIYSKQTNKNIINKEIKIKMSSFYSDHKTNKNQ